MSTRALLVMVWALGASVLPAWWVWSRRRIRPPVLADGLTASRERLLAALAPRLAHEVATPLTAVRGHLEVVADDPAGPAAARSLSVALAELDRVVELARDLLALTTVRAGAGPRTREQLAALVEEAVIGLLPLADELGATLTVQAPEQPLAVDVVAGDLIRAVRNLTANALRHGLGTARAVTVTVAPRGSARVRVAVHDSGAGLGPDQLAALSVPYVRGPAAPPGGAGLGLAIVTEVLAAHGSELHAGRDAHGGVLWFELPR